MKNTALIKLLNQNGYYFLRHGANHDLYTNGEKTIPVPRHSEIKERLAKDIIRKLGLK